jgi:hypothetical protein
MMPLERHSGLSVPDISGVGWVTEIQVVRREGQEDNIKSMQCYGGALTYFIDIIRKNISFPIL